MLNNFEQLSRVNLSREKRISKVIEFDLNEIKSHFDEDLKSIEDNFEVIEELEQNNKLEKIKNILRSQIVFLESAFDYYLHELSKYGIIKIYKEEWNKTERYRHLKIEMEYVEEGLNDPDSIDWILNYMNERFKIEVYISLDSMKNQLNLLGISLDEVIKIAFGVSIDKGKEIIKNLFSRRNEIVHQSDRSHYNATPNDIDKNYVMECIENVKKIVYTIHNIALSK